MTNDKASVSVLGLGAMGRALAGALLGAGHPTTVWNRTPDRADALVADGATLAATAADAVASNELILVCLLDYDAVDDVLETTDPAARTVVNLTSGTPAEARAAATALTARGAAYVDGGIMAIPPMIGGTGAFILYSGDRAAFARAEPALAALGRTVFAGEDAGRAALEDLALLSAMYGMFAGARHAAAFLRSEGADPGPFAQPYSCGIDAAMDVVGGKWKALILWALHERTHRFGELKRAVPGVTEKVLTEQLRELEADGIVHREVFDEVPPRVEYSLTADGVALNAALEALGAWGEQRIERLDLPRALHPAA